MKIPGQMRAADGLSTRADTRSAVREAVRAVAEGVGAHPDVALVFFTPHHKDAAGEILERIHDFLMPDALAGCTAAGVIGGGREVQEGPGLVIWAARLPGCRVESFRLRLEHGEGGAVVRGWREAGPEGGVVLLADPAVFPAGSFLQSLRRSPDLPPLVGGLASGGPEPGDNVLLAGEEVAEGGAVGIVLEGSALLQPVISQGCRPVGDSFVVTRCERGTIYELSGDPAYDKLRDLLRELDEEERRSFVRAPQVGLRTLKGRPGEEPGHSGFLIRGLTDVDAITGTMEVAELVEEGTELQFHTRDAHTAHRELVDMLQLASALYPRPVSGLLFDCGGRGVHMFGEPDHDVRQLRRFYPDLPVAGMFAAGEIGPVCGKPYLHGFSASLGLIVEKG